MSRRVVVPLPGGEFGEAALPWACAVTGPGDELHLLHASAEAAAPQYIPFPHHQEALLQQARAYLGEVATRLPNEGRAAVAVAVERGRPGPTITRYADRVEADLIAMSSHGRGPISRAWLGSTTDYVVRRSGVPVLVVRPEDGHTGVAPLPSAVAILLDGTPEAELALTTPELLGLPKDTRIVLMQVVTNNLPPAPLESAGLGGTVPSVAARRTAAAGYLAGPRQRLEERGYRNVVEAVPIGASVAKVAVDQAQQFGCELMALTTRGHRGMERLLLGSVADKVIRSGGPLILVFDASTH